MNTALNMSHDDGTRGPNPDDLPEGRPSVIGRIIARSRLALAKRESEEAYERFQRAAGPQAEHTTKNLYAESRMIPVDRIIDDPEFKNFRQRIDPVKLADLQTSIELDGLRIPITVIEAQAPGYFHTRAGFRRTAAVRNLGWTEIPAIVLPADMPRSEEYWVNILENCNRDKLSTYEIACAARKMRDEFHVTGHVFAKKTGHSPDYVYKLLSCLDRLPPEVIQSWKNGDQVPFSIYFDLSCMTPIEAIRNLRLWMGQRRIERVSAANAEKQAAESLRRLQTRRRSAEKLWTVRGVERTQRLLMAVKVSKLPEPTKEICVKIVEYCLGSRRRVDGVVDDHRRIPTMDLSAPTNDDLEVEMVSKVAPLENRELDKMRDKLEREHDDDNKDKT